MQLLNDVSLPVQVIRPRNMRGIVPLRQMRSGSPPAAKPAWRQAVLAALVSKPAHGSPHTKFQVSFTPKSARIYAWQVTKVLKYSECGTKSLQVVCSGFPVGVVRQE